MKPVIVLQTDFSETGSAVAVMKGVIKRVDPTLESEDLCHVIRKFDPFEASLSLARTVPYWPEGTVFVSVVDPGVGTSRKACIAKLKTGSYVITPDNGTLTHLKHEPGISSVRELDPVLCRYPGNEEVSVFHGRDIFAYTAALLASGKIPYTRLGKKYPVDEVIECEEYHRKPELSLSHVKGFLLTGSNHFGGVVMNILNAEFDQCGFAEGDVCRIRITHEGKTVFDEKVPYEKSFGYVKKGAPVLYKGSGKYISLDCNQDHFMNRYGIGFGLDWEAEIWK